MGRYPFYSPKGASPGRMPWMPSPAGPLGPGHPGRPHLRLEAILNTSPLLCGFVPPSPSSSCSALSMLSRSCSCWSSSLHSKGQELPWEWGTSYLGSPAVVGSQWGRTSTSHGVILQHLSSPLGWNSRLEEPQEAAKPTPVAFYWHLNQQRSQNLMRGKRNLHFSGR